MYGLTEEQNMIKQLARKIAEEKIKPIRAQLDVTGEFPHDVMKALAEADLTGLYIPVEYSGSGRGRSVWGSCRYRGRFVAIVDLVRGMDVESGA